MLKAILARIAGCAAKVRAAASVAAVVAPVLVGAAVLSEPARAQETRIEVGTCLTLISQGMEAGNNCSGPVNVQYGDGDDTRISIPVMQTVTIPTARPAAVSSSSPAAIV